MKRFENPVLVFQGNASGEFNAYRDTTGELLWTAPTQAMTVAAPSTYLVDGEQYVAVLVGGRALPTEGAGAIGSTTRASTNNSRMLVFKRGGTARLPEEIRQEVTEADELNPPPLTADFETVAQGEQLYGRFCGVCHGPAAVSASRETFPDLRYSQRLYSQEMFDSVVLGGELESGGMVSFEGTLQASDPDAIRHYIISRANADKEAGGVQGTGPLQ